MECYFSVTAEPVSPRRQLILFECVVKLFHSTGKSIIRQPLRNQPVLKMWASVPHSLSQTRFFSVKRKVNRSVIQGWMQCQTKWSADYVIRVFKHWLSMKGCFIGLFHQPLQLIKPKASYWKVLFIQKKRGGEDRERYCLLITLTCSPKAELRRAQLNGIGWMHVKGASGSRQTAMNDPGAQQLSQMFFTWVKARPQHRELRALLFKNSVWVL